MSGVTIYWGLHLEHSITLVLTMSKPSGDTDIVQDWFFDQLCSEFPEFYFIKYKINYVILVDGVPYDWNLGGVL